MTGSGGEWDAAGRSAAVAEGRRLLLVAHGSRDPRAAEATEDLRRAVDAAWPGGAVGAAYLDFTAPRFAEALADHRATDAAGHGWHGPPASPVPDQHGALACPGPAAPDQRGAPVDGRDPLVVVPLLLIEGYHGRVDIPGEISRAGTDAGLARVLGPVGADDRPAIELLVAALTRQLRSAGARRSDRGAQGAVDAIVLAGAGTKDPQALAGVDLVAAALGAAWGVPCLPGYAAGAGPDTGAVVAGLRSDGARRVAVAGYFLAPGLLHDRAVSAALRAGAVLAAEPLRNVPEIVDLIIRRALAAEVPGGGAVRGLGGLPVGLRGRDEPSGAIRERSEVRDRGASPDNGEVRDGSAVLAGK